ncbi:MAG: hypothetical protein ACRCV6_06835 [Formosimonas sp.]
MNNLFKGFFAGFVTWLLAMLVSIVFVLVVKMVVFPAFMGVPYVSSSEPIVVGSQEWYWMQLLGFLSAFVAGVATAKWSKINKQALLILMPVLFVLSIFSPINTSSIFDLALWYLEGPLGVVAGFYFYSRCAANRSLP